MKRRFQWRAWLWPQSLHFSATVTRLSKFFGCPSRPLCWNSSNSVRAECYWNRPTRLGIASRRLVAQSPPPYSPSSVSYYLPFSIVLTLSWFCTPLALRPVVIHFGIKHNYNQYYIFLIWSFWGSCPFPISKCIHAYTNGRHN